MRKDWALGTNSTVQTAVRSKNAIMDQDAKGSKKRRRSLRISQEIEICGNYGSVWKEPSPESRRVAELKEKRRRRSKIFNTEELLHFRNSETPEHASGDDRLGFFAIHSTPLLEVEEARCPDSNSGQQESLRITPVNITNDANPHSGKVGNMKGKAWRNSSPFSENPQEVYSTPVAPPRLSDSLPYSPSQSIVADISQSPLVNSLVSPNSPASDMEFFTPFSQIKPQAYQKKTGGKLQPRQLSSKYPDQDISKNPGEKLTLLKKSKLTEDGLQTYVTNNDVNNLDTIMKENETIVPCSSVILTDDATHLEANFTETQDILEKEDLNIVSTKVRKKRSHPKKNSSVVFSSVEPYSSLQLTEDATYVEDNKTKSQDILEEEDLDMVSTKVKKKRGRPRKNSSEVFSSKESCSSVLLTDDAPNLEDNFTERQDILEEEDLYVVSTIKGKKKRCRTRKNSSEFYSSAEPCSSLMLADDTTNLENNLSKCEVILEEENQTVEERKSRGTDDTTYLEDNFTENQDQEDHDIDSSKVNLKGSRQRKNTSEVFPPVEPCSSVLLTDGTMNSEDNFTDSQEILEEEDHDTASTKVKKKRGRPKKNSPEVLFYVEPCSSVLLTDDTNFEDNSTECEENQIVEERKSTRLRRRSFEIYRCSEEESSGQSNDSELQQEGQDFGTVLKDVNGKTVPAKAPRKKKKPESEDDINKIYTAKNYIPPPTKALETISELPTLAKQARKLKRLIEFGSLYHIPPIKQKKRQCKAAKRGWDPRKFRKNKIPDEVAQLKLQRVWEDLDKDSPTF